MPEAGPQAERRVFRLPGQARLGAVAPEGLVEAVLREGHEHDLGLAVDLVPLGRPGGDRDHPAHGVAAVARRIGAVDDVELPDLCGPHHIPFRREVPPVAEEVGDDKPVDEDQGPGALDGVGAPQGDHRVVVAGEALPDEEVGRVLHQVFDIDGVHGPELGLAEGDRKAPGLDGDGLVALADDDHGVDFRRVDEGLGGDRRQGRGGERQGRREGAARGAGARKGGHERALD